MNIRGLGRRWNLLFFVYQVRLAIPNPPTQQKKMQESHLTANVGTRGKNTRPALWTASLMRNIQKCTSHERILDDLVPKACNTHSWDDVISAYPGASCTSLDETTHPHYVAAAVLRWLSSVPDEWFDCDVPISNPDPGHPSCPFQADASLFKVRSTRLNRGLFRCLSFPPSVFRFFSLFLPLTQIDGLACYV